MKIFATLANTKAYTTSRTYCTAKTPILCQGKIFANFLKDENFPTKSSPPEIIPPPVPGLISGVRCRLRILAVGLARSVKSDTWSADRSTGPGLRFSSFSVFFNYFVSIAHHAVVAGGPIPVMCNTGNGLLTAHRPTIPCCADRTTAKEGGPHRGGPLWSPRLAIEAQAQPNKCRRGKDTTRNIQIDTKLQEPVAY